MRGGVLMVNQDGVALPWLTILSHGVAAGLEPAQTVMLQLAPQNWLAQLVSQLGPGVKNWYALWTTSSALTVALAWSLLLPVVGLVGSTAAPASAAASVTF